MDAQVTQFDHVSQPEACMDRCSPEPGAALAPRAILGGDATAACSDISDGQLLAVTDTAGLTADQLDRRHHLLRHRCLLAGMGCLAGVWEQLLGAFFMLQVRRIACLTFGCRNPCAAGH